MANKVSYTNLKLKTNKDVNIITFNDSSIEILKYLPINDKYDLIMVALQKSFEEGIYNPIKLDLYFHLNIIYLYTNINFTDKQKEDTVKLYDLCFSNGLLAAIIKEIPENEYTTLVQDIAETINAIYAYRNSVMGILETAVNDYGAVSLDASEIQQKLADPNNMTLLKDILDKLA